MPVPQPLQRLLQEPANQSCADCGAYKPTWASINLGVFICENCSGIHRSLGTHITQVRSVKLDTWKPEWIEVMKSMGNARANAYYEQNAPDAERFTGCTAQVGGDRLDREDGQRLERWIRAKYEERRYVAPGSSIDAAMAMAANRGSRAEQQTQQAAGPVAVPGWESAAPAASDVWGSLPNPGCGFGGCGPPSAMQAAGPGGDPFALANPTSPGSWPLGATAAQGFGRHPAAGAQEKLDFEAWGAASGAPPAACCWQQPQAAAAAAGPVAATTSEDGHEQTGSSKKRSHKKHASTSSVEAGGWTVDAVRLKQYTDGFAWADTDRDGLVTMAEAQEFLATSGLPAAELRRIWKMADVSQDSMLCQTEFICAMQLTFRRWQGVPLPPALPQELAALFA